MNAILRNVGNFFLIPIQDSDFDPIAELAFNQMDNTLQKSWVEGFDWNHWIQDLQDTLKDEYQVVLKIENLHHEFVGFLWLDHDLKGKILWITSFVLRPLYQRKGLGTIIINKLENYAKVSGFKTLQLGVQRINPAIQFYKKLDFVEIGKADYAGTILLRKDLTVKKEG
ncbi:MAG: GNAT family N-acetyltransferase [Promethearchaeota archaeon]